MKWCFPWGCIYWDLPWQWYDRLLLSMSVFDDVDRSWRVFLGQEFWMLLKSEYGVVHKMTLLRLLMWWLQVCRRCLSLGWRYHGLWISFISNILVLWIPVGLSSPPYSISGWYVLCSSELVGYGEWVIFIETYLRVKLSMHEESSEALCWYFVVMDRGPVTASFR